jgi:hypothetical protein
MKPRLATRVLHALTNAGCATLRDAEASLLAGRPLRKDAPWVHGVGVVGERALREVLSLPACPSRRIVLELVDGCYVDDQDVEWIRADELDEELAG